MRGWGRTLDGGGFLYHLGEKTHSKPRGEGGMVAIPPLKKQEWKDWDKILKKRYIHSRIIYQYTTSGKLQRGGEGGVLVGGGEGLFHIFWRRRRVSKGWGLDFPRGGLGGEGELQKRGKRHDERSRRILPSGEGKSFWKEKRETLRQHSLRRKAPQNGKLLRSSPNLTIRGGGSRQVMEKESFQSTTGKGETLKGIRETKVAQHSLTSL